MSAYKSKNDFNILTNEVVMCDECRTKLSNGENVEISHYGTGGYSPWWEGYACSHLQKIPTEEFKRRRKE
jgi:hypothetical protein